ncbi:MAG: arginine--tRNA ligase [Holophagaceae bacterium]|nr:arginine--tRNA ligase [Holophagaceae bacterium]
MDRIRKVFEHALAAHLPGQDIVIERPKNGSLGDLTFPCFHAAKASGNSPAQVATELASQLNLALAIEGVKLIAAGPYLNLKLQPEARAGEVLGGLLSGKPYGAHEKNGQKVIVEYSSPNIAKLFTIGHLRSTMIGHNLVQVHRFLGYDVVRLNHLGDWGTQFGTLLAAYKAWAETSNPDLTHDFDWAAEIPEKRRTPLFRLFQLYVRFHDEEKENPDMREDARRWFRELEQGSVEARRLWKWFRDISLTEFQRIYDRLGVSFDTLEQGEAFYEPMLGAVLQRLSDHGLLKEGEGGAKIVDLSDVGIETPMVVQKGDGASIYASRDLAQVTYRKEAYLFDRCIYVIGGEQILHMKQIFACMEKLDPWFKGRLTHTPFGLVRLPEGKMSTRKGNVIFLEDVLDEAAERVAAIIQEKNPDLANQSAVAEMLGMGAVIFFNAMNDRIKPITFEWDRVIALDGDTGPYVQYAHARICSVLRKAGGAWPAMATPGLHDSRETAMVPFPPCDTPSDLKGLDAPEAQNLLFELAGLPSAVRVAREQLMATSIARQLLAIARSFSGFYTNCPILAADNAPEVREARLALCVATARALRQGLFLIGIEAPEEM